MLDLKKTINNARRHLELAKKIGLDLKTFILPVSLSFLGTFFEGVTLAALLAFIKGIISRDFQFIKAFPAFGKIAVRFPPLTDLSNTDIFLFLLSTVFLSAILKNMLLYLSQLSISYQVGKSVSGLRRLILERYIKFGKMFFDRNSVSYIESILSYFSSQIGQQFCTLNNLINTFLMLALYLVVMFSLSWKISMLVLLIFPVINLLLKQLIIKIKKNSEYLSASSIALSGKLFNILSCMTLVKLYNNEKEEQARFHDFNEQLRGAEFSIQKKSLFLHPLREMAFLCVVVLLTALMAYLFVKEKTGSLSAYLAYFYILRRAQGSFGVFSDLNVMIAQIAGPVKYFRNILSDDEKFIVPQGVIICHGLEDRISFSRLNFGYYNNRQVLFDVSFSVEKGKKVAIVGSTGSGKTTLVNLLMRFYDCPAGSIFIDGTDIRDFTISSILGHFAYVSQETLLFSDTLRNNIVYGLKCAPSEKRVDEVLQKARLSDFVASLPQGLDTHIGDRGVKLSGGERQRVAIARAMLKDSEILVLDEATSSLDSTTEKFIQESINEAIREKTVIVIAHRLSTIRNVDKIVVIENGRTVEDGSLNELLEKKGKFYEYWQEQKFY